MSDTMIVVLLGAIASLVAILTPIIKVTSSITEIKAEEQRIASQEAVRFFRREADTGGRDGRQAAGSLDVHSDHVDSGFTEA